MTDGLIPLEDAEQRIPDRTAILDLSIRHTLTCIDHALDVGNRSEFMRLAKLLRDYRARYSRAPDTP